LVRGGLPLLKFASALDFSTWLATDGSEAKGAWLLFARKGSDLTTLTRQEAIDCALCAGWIDGQAAPLDASFSLVRFTPRRPRGNWSEVNRMRALELVAAGRMLPRGEREIEQARSDGRWDRAYPSFRKATVPDDLRVALDASPRAAARFDSMSKTERYAVLLPLATARMLETRQRRIAAFVAAAEARD
jgi:uncharacterized protein YdeI (YjbR/CyaY-like superfamily)